MPTVNDQVLTPIALTLGLNDQIPPATLAEQLLPVLQADDYRREFAVLRASVNPTGGAGIIQYILQTPETEMWNVLFVGFTNPSTGNKLIVDGLVISVRDTAVNWNPVRQTVNVGFKVALVGNGTHQREGISDPIDVPESIMVPSNFQLAFRLTANVPPFILGAIQSLEVLIERIPKERRIALEAFQSLVIP